ncbi:hypothetical protein BKA70DRAFT_1430624 [Coprinopsis sp. MPI-PUGE-AT-0042]|nr:hypothetical protein BKA70DRAFT_1430624 [Coprinopsis sp. MPI-PUGE-AT-0042]
MKNKRTLYSQDHSDHFRPSSSPSSSEAHPDQHYITSYALQLDPPIPINPNHKPEDLWLPAPSFPALSTAPPPPTSYQQQPNIHYRYHHSTSTTSSLPSPITPTKTSQHCALDLGMCRELYA